MKLEKLIKALFAEWPAKVLSLAVALFLMLFFNLTRLEQRTISIPLALSVNEGMAPASQYPRMVRVTLRGEREVIYGIREDEVSASLDMTEYKSEGVFKEPVRIEKRGNALIADPLEIRPEPAEIAIGLEKKVAKTVPVTPSFKGFLESGFELSSFDVNPPEVTISGPAGLVARCTEISTDTIELSGKKSDFTVNVRLLKKEPLLSLESRDSIAFSAKVQRSMDIRTFVNLKILPKGLRSSLELGEILPTGQLRAHIPEAAMRDIDQNALLYIDLSGFSKPGTYTADVAVSLPPEAVMETFEPQRLTIVLQEAGSGVGGGLSGAITPSPSFNFFNVPSSGNPSPERP